MRRSVALLLALVAPFAVAASDHEPVVTEAVVAEDVCGDVAETGEAVAPAHDLCEVTFRTTTSADAPTRLEITLRVAGEVDTMDTTTDVRWSGGGCHYDLVRHVAAEGGSGDVVMVGDPEEAHLWVACGEPRPCTMLVLGVPTVELPGSDCSIERFPVGAARVDGDSVTVEVVFTDELVDHGAVVVPGTELLVDVAAVGPAAPGRVLAGWPRLPGCDPDCGGAVWDTAPPTGAFTVG